MEQGEREEFNRVVDHEVKGHFPAGAVRRAVLLRHGDEQGIEAGYLLLRVFVEVPDEQRLAVWRDTHRAEVDGLRRDLSRRLPSARLLELTFDEPGAPRISVPDDGSLTTERLSGREIVTKALALVRANYVFPELAEQAATAIEARLAAGEYDQLDEITLTELVTRHLQEATGDRHLAVMLGDVPPPYLHRSIIAREVRGAPDSAPCPLIAAGSVSGRPCQGARSARGAAHRRWPLTRAAREPRSCRRPGAGSPGCAGLCGCAVRAGGPPWGRGCAQPWRRGAGAVQPALPWPAGHLARVPVT